MSLTYQIRVSPMLLEESARRLTGQFDETHRSALLIAVIPPYVPRIDLNRHAVRLELSQVWFLFVRCLTFFAGLHASAFSWSLHRKPRLICRENHRCRLPGSVENRSTVARSFAQRSECGRLFLRPRPQRCSQGPYIG